MATNNETTDNIDPPLMKSQLENGCYTNSFNRNFKLPTVLTALRLAASTDHTNLPNNPQELDKELPVNRHQKDQIRKTSPGMRFIWIGHATCLVQINNFMFITDPVFSERCSMSGSFGPKRFRPPALNVNDLPDELNAVLISHNHYDHLDAPSVIQLNERYGNKLTWYCGLGVAQWLCDCQIEHVVELDWWEKRKFQDNENIQVAFCPAQHWSRRGLFDTNKSLWGGYAVHCDKYKFYFAGDTGYTDNIPIFKQIGKKYGPFDLSAIPIGAYEPRSMMGAQHVSPKEAFDIHTETGSKKSIGIHWGTWALANEFYLEPKTELEKIMKERQGPGEFITVQHGEIVDLPDKN